MTMNGIEEIVIDGIKYDCVSFEIDEIKNSRISLHNKPKFSFESFETSSEQLIVSSNFAMFSP